MTSLSSLLCRELEHALERHGARFFWLRLVFGLDVDHDLRAFDPLFDRILQPVANACASSTVIEPGTTR